MLFQIDGSVGVPYNICKKGQKYVKSNCESIFLWNKDRSNFISLFNVTLLNNYTHNLDSIRDKTVRVVADNVSIRVGGRCRRCELFSLQMLPYITSSNYSQTLGGFLGEVWQMIESTLGFT
jgi:hypothetical protein